MKLQISVLLIVGLVICPFINATASEGSSNVTADPHVPAALTPSPFRAESRSSNDEEEAAAVDEEDEEFDLADIMNLFGGPAKDYAHVKRSSNDYYIDMDMSASNHKEQQYQWKTASQPKASASTKKTTTLGNNGQLRSGNGKVYTLHIVTEGQQEGNVFGNQGRASNQHHHYSSAPARPRSPRSKVHVIPVTMRSSPRHNHSVKKVVKRFRGPRPDEHVKYDSHSHSEEVQDIILPAESEIVDTKYDIVHPNKEIHTNDLKLGEGSEQESQYIDHDPYDHEAEKVKVKHHHHHHHHNHVKTVIKKVPQPYPVEKIVHVPVEKVVHVPKPYPVDKFVEKIVHVPVERVIQVPKPVPVDRVVEKVVHVPKPYPVDRIVEKPVPVNRPVRVNVPYPVEKIVHVPKPYPVEKIVEKIVHVPKPYPVIKHVHVPVPVEKKVPFPVKVEVEKKVPYPVKVYIPKPYPVEKKVPAEVEAPPKKNSYRSNFEKNRMPGAQSYVNLHQGHFSSSSSGSGREQASQQWSSSSNVGQGQASTTTQQFQQSFAPQMTAQMDYGFAQQTPQAAAPMPYPYQFEQSQDTMQYTMNVMPTGQESEQQDYVYNTSEQSMGPSGAGGASAADSVDAASSDSVVNVAPQEPETAASATSSASAGAFEIHVPDHHQQHAQTANVVAAEPQFAESNTVSHLLQITPFTTDPKTLAYTRPVDQFVVFHTGTGFTVPK